MEKRILDRLLRRISAGGIRIRYWDGQEKEYGPEKPYLTLHIKNRSVIRRLLTSTSLGFAESYIKGQIEADGDLSLVLKLIKQNQPLFGGGPLNQRLYRYHMRRKTLLPGYVTQHYDLDPELFKLWLGPSLYYSCAYFGRSGFGLEEAQAAKTARTIKRLELQDGMKLLDLGSGWGSFLIDAAKAYKRLEGRGVTLSRAQLEYSKSMARRSKSGGRVTFEYGDMMDLPGDEAYDRIVALESIEHCGSLKNLDNFCRAASRSLKPDGLMLIQAVVSRGKSVRDPFMDKYIFPGGFYPGQEELVSRLKANGFVVKHREIWTPHYVKTVECYMEGFGNHKKAIVAAKGEEFYAMMYLAFALLRGNYAYGNLDLVRLTLVKS